jgi:hypothetical protein
MVTITNYRLRENKMGKSFVALELQGDVEFVQSLETGRFYATSKRCTITSTFDEERAKSLIGTKLPGKIERQSCEGYDFTVPESGEVIKLAHTYNYAPDENSEVTYVRQVSKAYA